jgi:pimeloyl-ACP methyl ester carboxylesterase
VRRLATVAALLVATQLVIAPVSSAEAASCPTSQVPDTAGQSATRRPVVFVHGWIGEPMTEAAAKLRQQLGDRISTSTFDYSRWALHWASDSHIAPCLADYINTVSAAHKKVRGDGKVVVIAHSMGGLAIRYAMDPDIVKSPATAATVSDIITLGTPHLGSPWGGTNVADWVAEVITHFGRERPPANAGGSRCLARHDKGAPLAADCGPLPPYLPAGVTLTQLAGDITVDRTLFGFTVYSLPIFTDGIVPVPSAHGYVTSGDGGFSPPDMAKAFSRTETCRVDFGKVSTSAERLSFSAPFDYLTLQDLQRGEQTARVLAMSAGATFIASCGHMNLPTSQSAISQVAELIKAMPPAKPVQPAVKVDPADYHMPYGGYGFLSPSGRFDCGIMPPTAGYPGMAGCQGETKPVPPRPPDCSTEISWGGGLYVDDAGEVDYVCAGGLMFSNGNSKILPYGAVLAAEGMTCTSAETGMRCVNDKTGHGFRIASASNERF